MALIQQIKSSLFEISLGAVNAHLIQTNDELILIDTGSPQDETKILAALAEIGRAATDLTAIIVTHCHPDHAGSLAALQTVTNAPTFMHRIDAEMVTQGKSRRPLTPAPGMLNKLLFRLFIASAPETIAPARVDHEVEDDELLSLVSGLRVIHTPGHSLGQISLLWEPEGVLFAADSVTNQPRLAYHIGYEDFGAGQQSASKLASLLFETAVFGHGKPIIGQASETFKQKFSQTPTKIAAVSSQT